MVVLHWEMKREIASSRVLFVCLGAGGRDGKGRSGCCGGGVAEVVGPIVVDMVSGSCSGGGG